RAIESPKLPGIQISQEYRRFYPNKELAGQLLGAVGYDAKALGGLELTYDQFLRSATTNKSVERDARGKFFSEPDQNLDTHHLYLTIDKNIQTFAETALKKTATKHQAKSGFALVLDVKTGEVLAMANYPGFNPNAYWKYPLDHWKNHAVIDVFEPGSTFKTILMAAALQNRTTKPTDRFFCENGQYQVGKNTINDHSPYGWLDAKTILQVSSNIGVTKIAQKLGRKKFYEFIKEIGFGKEVDVGVSGESAGAVRPYKSWRDIDFSNIAFGQGISVNGLQMTRAYGAIANGGHLFKPFLVKEIVDNSGHSVHKTEPINEKEVLDPTIAGELKQMLHLVTQTGGTSTQAHVPGYLSGGKTGTAQKFDTRL
ncbi:MAG TPA: penicillin-binding protein 2, partial [bacterium]|nr:penicillin-binding protein 2 [bacterium]